MGELREGKEKLETPDFVHVMLDDINKRITWDSLGEHWDTVDSIAYPESHHLD